MKKQALSLAVLVAGSFPVASNALSLGDIRSNSSLNQPLRAKIELLSTSAQEAQQLQVRLAPNNVFSRVGVDRPAFLDSLRFRSATENGKPVILITSDAPIAEPFVNFLLEVSWPQGQLLKEYTVMLDPPVLMQPGTALAGKEAAVRAEPRSTGVVSRPPAPSASPTQIAAAQQQQQQAQRQRAAQQAQQQRTAQQAQQQAQQRQRAQQQQQAAQQRQAQQRQNTQQQRAQPARNTSRTYRVRRGDTLFKVASRLRQPGINVDQMMMALYRANPGAFISGNINGLKAGAVLRAPSAQAAKSSSRAQARRQVRQQYAQWTKFRSSLAKNTVPQQAVSKQPTNTASTQKRPTTPAKQPDKARLEVLGKADKASTAKGASAGSPNLAKIEKELALANESVVARQRENKELKSRITDLESMLRKKNRLIALRDDQLAQLQKKLAEGATGTPVTNAQTAQQNGTTTQPRQGVVPRTTGDTNQATTGRDIQNQAANAAEAEKNKIVRAQPPANDQLSAAEQRTKKLADDARKMAQDKMANKQPATDPATDNTANNSPFADEQAGGPDLMSMLSSPMAWKIGAGALTSLLLLWLLSRLFGRRKAKGDRIPPVANEQMPFDDDDMDLDKADANADRQYAGLEAELDKAEQYNELDDDPFGTQLTNEETASHVNDIVEAESTSDEDEVLMEANVYIAYGLHQQAESELKKALEKHPDRLEYRHKLLENYFASNNRDEFDAQAAAFMDTAGADKDSKMWREIAEWGGKISPDNKLYQQSDDGIGLGALATGAAAATAAVGAGAAALMGSADESDAPTQLSPASEADAITGLDDDLGLDDFDFDLDELENELGNLESLDDDAVHLNDAVADLGSQSALNDSPALDNSELASTVDDSLDFSLDDLANELEKDQGLGTDSGLDMPDAVSAEIDNLAETVDEPLDFDVLLNGSGADDDSDSALPDIALADSSDDDGIGMLGGLAAGAVAAAGAATAAVMTGKDKVTDALGDAGQVGSDALDGVSDKVEDSLDFTSDKLSDASDAVDTEFDSLDDLDFDFDPIATEEESGDLMDDLDFNLDQMEPEPEVPTIDDVVEAEAGTDNVTNLNLHLDQDSGLRKILPQDTFYAQDKAKPADSEEDDEDSWLGDIDDALSFLDMPDEEIDLHEAHISTKLDLARAYLDMGDIEGARSTLEEVMVEGNDNQRREAEDLLHETG